MLKVMENYEMVGWERPLVIAKIVDGKRPFSVKISATVSAVAGPVSSLRCKALTILAQAGRQRRWLGSYFHD